METTLVRLRMIMRDIAGEKLSKLSCKVGKKYKVISSRRNKVIDDMS